MSCQLELSTAYGGVGFRGWRIYPVKAAATIIISSMKKPDPQKSAKARQIYCRLYNIFRRKSGYEDTLDEHSFNQKSGKDGLTPWDRLVLTLEKRSIDPPGYIFTTLKKIIEEHGSKDAHPHFLLSTDYLNEYTKNYPTICRSIEIKWQDQLLMFASGLSHMDTMQWFGDATTGEKMQYVLLSDNRQFTDLFVFSKAVLHRFDRLEAELREKAKFEYSLFASVYDGLINNKKVLRGLK